MSGQRCRVLVYGAGRTFLLSVSILKKLEDDGDCEIVAITSNDIYANKLLFWPYIPKSQVNDLNYDCVLCAVREQASDVRNELEQIGIIDDDIVPLEALYIPFFSFNRYLKLKRQHLSIIANMCWGGVTYHYFRLAFLSPFINMFMLDEDYLRLLSDLKLYLSQPLGKCTFEEEKFMHCQYPCYSLGECCCNGVVHLHMNHYKDEEEGRNKWEVRKQRINWNNILVMMYTENPKSVEQFEALPFERKICFTNFSTDSPSALYLEIFKSASLANCPAWQIVSGLASGRYVFYDPWEIMLDGTHMKRWIS